MKLMVNINLRGWANDVILLKLIATPNLSKLLEKHVLYDNQSSPHCPLTHTTVGSVHP